ncbi:MAG: isoprenylcysteine carboxylmethyltransferase family protein [Roseobacter sp.]
MKWLNLPPFWLAGCVALAYGQSRIFPIGLSLAHPVTSFFAGLCVGAGGILTGLAVIAFKRHHTTIMPHEEATHLIQSGVFKISRNPIYLADVLILLGFVLWWDAVPSLVLVPVLFLVLETRFVLPEEDRLRTQFRVEFARYAQKTRRWL